MDVPNICEQSLQLRKHQGGTHQQQQQHQVGTHQQQQQRQVGTLLIFLCGAIFGCCKNKIKKDRSKRSMKVKVTKSYHSDHTYYDAAVKEGILLYSHVMLSWSSLVEATDCPIVAQVWLLSLENFLNCFGNSST